MSINYRFVDRFDSMGLPVRMNKDRVNPSISNKKTFSDAFMSDVLDKLPEGKALPAVHPEWMIPCDIKLVDACTAKFTYITEGAGYRNAVGYYVYDIARPPTTAAQVTERRILIPNYSGNETTKFYGTTGGGSLKMGDTIDLPYELDLVNFNHNYVFPAGKAIGFFVMSNAWRGAGAWTSGDAPAASTRLNLSVDVMFSNPALNTNNPADQRCQFVCLQSKIDPDVLIYGVEDIKRPGGDKDFNDAVYCIEASPITAVDTSTFIRNVETKVTNWGTVFLEDDVYDNDYNDVIFTYEAVENIDDRHKIKEIKVDLEVLARGSWHDHTVGIQIPNISNLKGTVQRQQRGTDGRYSDIFDDSDTVFNPENTNDEVVIVPKTKAVTADINGGDGFGWNCGPKWQSNPKRSVGFRLLITFAEAIPRGSIRGAIIPFTFFARICDTQSSTANMDRDGVTRTYYADQEYEDSSYYWKYQKLDKVPKLIVVPRYSPKMPQDKQPIWKSYPFIVPYLMSGKNQDFKWYKYPYQCYNLETVVPATKEWTIEFEELAGSKKDH